MMKKKGLLLIILLLIAAASFAVGYWASRVNVTQESSARKILYYVDPMNPAFKSEKPGIAPCGMSLEPVYAAPDSNGPAGTTTDVSVPPGSIRISSEKQQLIGVKTATVEKVPWSHTLRVLGRITPDETRVYRINAAVNGWIEEARQATTGSLVNENDILATFYSLEYRNLVQNYFNLINVSKEGAPGEKAVTRTSQYSTGQLKRLREAASAIGNASESSQIEYYRRNLYNFGMSPYQVEEMERTRKIPDFIEIRSPIRGFVLNRNVSPGLRFDRGTEFFRIADLSTVWILADLFENEASYFRPGQQVKIELPYQKKILYARVSSVLPQFDSTTRTLKLRLTAANPGYIMRPDMFVNVELTVNGSPAIIVPVDAVLDSGLKKTIFIDRGNGVFEPRRVETGRFLGERVEIVNGLMPGEKIVVSGNFLIDSEARMQQAASGISEKISRDPVCGMNTDEGQARRAGHYHEYQGKPYFFCSSECRNEFVKSPERYSKMFADQKSSPLSSTPSGTARSVKTKTTAAPNHRNHDHAAMHGSEDVASPMPPAEDKMMKSVRHKTQMPADAAMNHQVPADHGPARGPASSVPLPMPEASKALRPANGKMEMPADDAGPAGETMKPIAGPPMSVTPAGNNAGMMPGKQGTAPPLLTGGAAKPLMSGGKSDMKTDKAFSPAMDAPSNASMPGRARKALPEIEPEGTEASVEKHKQKARYPAGMRVKTPGRVGDMSSPPDTSISSDNETFQPGKFSPAGNVQMKPADGE